MDSEASPILIFFAVVLTVNVILVLTFEGFDIDIESSPQYDSEGFLESIASFFIDLTELSLIGGLFEFLQFDYIGEAISIWAIVPTPLFIIIIVPLFAAFVYAVIKALPTT